jgi:hypothetical protein
MAATFALAVTSTVGGAPPISNVTVHPINAPLEPDLGINCGTGMPTLTTGSFSGVVHVLVLADGTVHINGSAEGSAINDDLAPDGNPDAITSFRSAFGDVVRPGGSQSHRFVLNGSGTTTATGETFRFHVHIYLLGIRFAYPASWFVTRRPLSDGLDGEYVFTVSTHPVRRTARDQGACLWGIARQLPKDGVLAFLVEANEVERRSLVREFDPRPRTFPLPSRTTGAVCGFPRPGGGRGAWIPFQSKGRAFTLAIQIGPWASRASVEALQRMLDGMQIAPR